MYGGSGICALRGDRRIQIRACEIERQFNFAGIASRADRRIQRSGKTHLARAAQVDAVSDLQPLGRTRKGPPAVLIDTLGEIERDVRFRVTAHALALRAPPGSRACR